jgi:hypothetical protein
MDDRKDWRSFGSYTFDGMMNDWYFGIFMKKISLNSKKHGSHLNLAISL